MSKQNKKQIVFARFGGLSPVKYERKNTFSSFHKAPSKKGIYAFLYPYIESFLWVWNETKYKNIKERKDRIRKFTYNGPIWCHFTEHFPHYAHNGSWVCISMDEYKKVLKKVVHADIKWLKEHECEFAGRIRNPYKRGLGGGMGKDHLEVFIEAKYLGKIRRVK